jgi:signal transduction histidine kinase
MTLLVAFGIGALALGAVYLVVLAGARSLTMTQRFVTGTAVEMNGRVFFLPEEFGERELRTVEGLVKEILLNQIALSTIIAVAVMFVLAVIVSWVVAGRALRPITSMTAVAEEIEATDLTRRIDVDGPDDELKAMATTFNGMLDRLDGAFRGQRQFLAETSHDLRTPLATIRTNVDVALADATADVESWRETGAVVARAAERMSSMLDDLLATARMQAGAVEMVEFDLAKVVELVADETAGRASDREVGLSVHAGTASVSGDRRSLTRAVANLVENALEVAPKSSTVELACGLSEEGLPYVSVGDRGPGIDVTVVEGVRSSPGLGLSIVRDIAVAHGGRLVSVDRPDGGALLVVWLPSGGGEPLTETPDPPLERL